MPRDASGNFTRPVSPYQAHTLADVAPINTEMDGIAEAISQSLSRYGQGPMMSALNMGAFRITNLAPAEAADHAVRRDQAVLTSGNSNIAGALTVEGTISTPSLVANSTAYAARQNGSQFVSPYHVSNGLIMTAVGLNSTVKLLHNPGVDAIHQITVDTTNFDFVRNGNAYATGTWISGSDARVKANREPISGALDRVDRITGETYDRIDMNGRRDIGLIAQEVAKVLPEAVHVGMAPPTTDPHGSPFLSINYNAVVALLVQAVKELRAEVATLKNGGA